MIIIKMPAGLCGNLISQTIRGSLNLILGFLQILGGFFNFFLVILQSMSGGFEVAKLNFIKGKSNLKRALLNVGIGFLQILCSPFSAIARAGQIANEPFFYCNGVYSPCSKNPNYIQNLFGLDGWKEIEEEIEQNIKTPKQKAKTIKPIKKIKISEKKWELLLNLYENAQTKRERIKIQRTMAMLHPLIYSKKLKEIKNC